MKGIAREIGDVVTYAGILIFEIGDIDTVNNLVIPLSGSCFSLGITSLGYDKFDFRNMGAIQLDAVATPSRRLLEAYNKIKTV